MLVGDRKISRTLHNPSPVRRLGIRPFNPLAGEQHMPLYIRVPSKDRAEARAAKWDLEMQSWFIPQDKRTGKVSQAFEKWPIGLSEQKKSFSRKKAQELGALEDQGLGLGD
ncbi:MAG: hypothetical protein HRT36_08805 [Alphaproteobacteria bacterium]|nr:hypothetical protein [Alphaproteobacteria bacterium]